MKWKLKSPHKDFRKQSCFLEKINETNKSTLGGEGRSLKSLKLQITMETLQQIPVKFRKSQSLAGFVLGGLYPGLLTILS